MATRPGVRLAILISALAAPWQGQALAQADLRDPTRPILVLNPGGHGAPVQALAFTRGGGQLLSGGMDKVIHAWDVLGDAPSLAGTIRPPIWRGPRGVIYALALSPDADEKGRQVLAVGGYGVQSQNGNIALYRVPAADRAGTGDLLAQLPCGNRADAEPVGHWDTVKCLAFDPKGNFLASGSFDGTVRIWDRGRREAVAVLVGHAGKPVRALAFGPDGKRLATAGGDGDTVLWDTDPAKLREHDRARRALKDPAARKALAEAFNRRAILARAKPGAGDVRADDPRGASINALAYSPGGRWIVIGRENGRLTRYDGATLAGAQKLPTDDRRQGAVEALAFAPDGKTLAVSLLAQRLANRAERPPVGCDVELRSIPDGAVVGPQIPRVSNLVQALAFSPDGKALAYAGGDDQAVFLKDLRDPNRAPTVLAGQGGSLWDVGFSRDGKAVAYARLSGAGAGANPPETFEAFDLAGRRGFSLPGADVVRGQRTLNGLTVRPTDLDALEVVDAKGVVRPLTLAATDGRWWDYCILAPTADRPKAAVAVAVEAGVVIFAETPDGKAFRRVRQFAGHSGSVYALAPSPDGKWLVTGSSDQTLRLWPLAHRDALPTFGATFAPDAAGRIAATAVEPRSFAEEMGLLKGDVVEKFFAAGAARPPKDAITAPDAAPPESRLEFVVRRGEKVVELGNTKRDGPALALFPSKDREWVLWMPQGYYDTSIVGDRKFLGWHRNGAKEGGGFDIDAPTDYFTIDKFEGELRRPGVLDALIASADPGVALALVPAAVRDAPALVADQSPPKVEVIEPALPADRRLVVRSPALAVRAAARTDDRPEGRRALGSVRFFVDGQPQQEINPLKPEFDAPANLTLTPGLHHINVVAVDDAGRERTRTFPVEYLPPDDLVPAPLPDPKTPRLLALTLGVQTFSPGSGLPPIPFAANDAKDVAAFLQDPKTQRFGKSAESRIVADPTSAKIEEALALLQSEQKEGRWGPGDTLVVLVESHVLLFEKRSLVLGADAGGGEPPSHAVPVANLTDALGELARYGVRVLVLIDGVHEQADGSARPDSRVAEWARDLYKRNVIAFPASIQGPGRRLSSRSHGAFAEAIVNSLDARTRTRLPNTSGRPMDLDEFRDAVEQGVQRLTALQQFARCYIPPTLPARTTLFEPPAGPTALTSRP